MYANLDTKTSKYLGVTISDAFLLDFVNEMMTRTKEVNVVELMSLFPELDPMVKNAKLSHLELLLPDVVERYGKDSDISLLISPAEAPEDHVEYAQKSNKVVFKKDTIELLVSFYFDLVLKEDGQWTTIRQGVMGFGGKSTVTIKQALQDYWLSIKPASVGIKKLGLVDPSIEDEDERLVEHESAAILGIVNLMLKKLAVPKDFVFYQSHLDKLNLFGMSRKIAAEIQKGFIDVTTYSKESDESTEFTVGLTSIFEPISEGFYKAELKKQVAHEKKENRMQLEKETGKTEL